MSRTERNLRIRRDRRHWLAYLRLSYPRWVTCREVYVGVVDVSPDYGEDHALADLTYLVGRGYVEWRGRYGLDERALTLERCECRATPAGCDVADRIIDDPTLEP